MAGGSNRDGSGYDPKPCGPTRAPPTAVSLSPAVRGCGLAQSCRKLVPE